MGELAMEQLKLSEQYGANDPLYVSAPEFSELVTMTLIPMLQVTVTK